MDTFVEVIRQDMEKRTEQILTVGLSNSTSSNTRGEVWSVLTVIPAHNVVILIIITNNILIDGLESVDQLPENIRTL